MRELAWYNFKIIEIGNIIKKEIINFSLDFRIKKKELKILVLGKASQIFAEILPKIFKKCHDIGISIKIIQQSLPHQNRELS